MPSRGRRRTTYIAHIDALLRRWDAWDARTAEHAPEAGGAVRGAAPPPPLPPPPPPALTREALLELRAILVEELEHLEPKP